MLHLGKKCTVWSWYLNMKQLSLKIVQKYKALIYLTWEEENSPIFFFLFFFLRREGEKGCLIHFFRNRQPPSALNKSTSGWPVEARKMAATKYFFARLGKSKQWLLLFLEELAQDYFSVMEKYQLEFQSILLLATVTIGLFTYRSHYIHLFCK